MQAFLDSTAELSQAEAAARAPGITQKDVSRWRRGDWNRLTAKKRRALLRAAELPVSRGEYHGIEPEALELFRDPETWLRYVGGVAPAGQQKALKRDILNGLRIVITATEPLPQWWKDAWEMVENDEL